MSFAPIRFAGFVASVFILSACGGGGGGGSSSPAPHGSLAIAEADSDHDGLIEISNLEQLDWIRNDTAGTSLTDFDHQVNSKGCPSGGCFGYELVADLNFDTNGDGQLNASDSYYDYDKDGSNTGWKPIHEFAGSFEGNGRHIKNLYINRPKGNLSAGLFAQININPGATVKIQNVFFDGPLSSITGRLSAATLAGQISNQGTLTLNHITQAGSVIATGSSLENGAVASFWYAGGIVGEINTYSGSTLIVDSNSATSTVESTIGMAGGLIARISATNENQVVFTNNSAFSHVTGSLSAGGLVASMTMSSPTSTFANNSSFGDTEGSDGEGIVGNAGGAVGDLNLGQGSFRDNYSTSSVIASVFAGGLIGSLSGKSTLVASSHATGIVNGATAGGLIGRMACGENLYVEESYASGHVLSPFTVVTSGSSLTVTGGSAGGLIGWIYDTTGGPCGARRNYASGDVSAGVAGGIIGSAQSDTTNGVIELTDSFAVGAVHAGLYAGGLAGKSHSLNGASFNVVRNLALGNITADYGLSGPQTAGLVSSSGSNDRYMFNHWATDTTTVSISVYMTGMSLVQMGNVSATRNSLQCPITANDFTCATGELFHDWGLSNNSQGELVWEFGSTAQLPGLRINGAIHRPVFDGTFYSVSVTPLN